MTTLSIKSGYRGAVPQFAVNGSPLYVVPAATSGILKNVIFGNVANGIPIYTVGTRVWSNNSVNLTVGAPCADQSPADGAIYFSYPGEYVIRKMDNTGTVTPFVGTGFGATHADGTGLAAGFQAIHDLVIDSTGTNMYVCDNLYVRKVVLATGVVTTIAGNNVQAQTANAVGTSGSIYQSSLCIDAGNNNLYLMPMLAGAGGTLAIQAIALTGTFALTNIVSSAGFNNSQSSGGVIQNINRIAIVGSQLYFWNFAAGVAIGAIYTCTTAGAGLTAFVNIAANGANGYAPILAANPDDSSVMYFGGYPANGNGTISRFHLPALFGSVNYPPLFGGGSTGGQFGTSQDGPLGTGQFYGTPLSCRIRGGNAIIMTDGTYSGTLFAGGLYRVNLVDGFLQRLAGTPSVNGNNTGTTYYGKGLLNSPAYTKLWIVPSGGTLGEAYQLGKLYEINPGETLVVELDASMQTGDMLYAEALTPGATMSANLAEAA